MSESLAEASSLLGAFIELTKLVEKGCGLDIYDLRRVQIRLQRYHSAV